MNEVIDDDDLPRAFGAYLLLQNFARGGMGDVYLAKSGGIAGLERTCVVKKLRAELSQDREYVTRFVDEARVVVTLHHANICNVFDVGKITSSTSSGPIDEYYLAMEYIAGRDVRTLLDKCRKRGRPVDANIAVHIVADVLKALDYAHRRRHPVTDEPLNLVHRDVSPQNVLVSYEGEIKLIDFGLAASRLKVEKTAPNVVMGKMAYMSPEQARGDGIDSRADIFACGVLLYELLVGERYYEGMTPKAIWDVAGRGGFLPRGWASIDPMLQMILSRALHSDPGRRTPSCGAFREELLGLAMAQKADAERTLRELMAHTFADDIARERALMARFASVSLASYQASLEDSRANMTVVASSSPPAPAAPEAAPVVDSNTSPVASVPNGATAIAAPSAARDGTQIVARPVRPAAVENSGVDAAAFGHRRKSLALLLVGAIVAALGAAVVIRQRAMDEEIYPTPAFVEPQPAVAAAPVAAAPNAPVVEAPAVVEPVVEPVDAAPADTPPAAAPHPAGMPVSVAVVAKPTSAKPLTPAAAPAAVPAVPQPPPAAPKPVAPVATPVSPPAPPISKARWREFKAAHESTPCVQELVLRGFGTGESTLLIDQAQDIRACASTVGESL